MTDLMGGVVFEGYAMTKRALVTGSAERAQAVADLFRLAGVEATAVSELDGLVDVPRPCDYYVQLPVTVSTRGDSVVQRLHSFLIDGLLSRFVAVERVLPMLAPGATVVLVPGTHRPRCPHPTTSWHDWHCCASSPTQRGPTWLQIVRGCASSARLVPTVRWSTTRYRAPKTRTPN
jgi:hypothetical protein